MEIMPLLKKAQDYLSTKGIENPRLTTEILLAHCLGLKRIDLYLNYDRPLNERELSTYRSLLSRRAQHYPLQYLTGEVEFYSSRFLLAEGVFIPRPETEVLVERVKEAIEREAMVADIGTGCGVIAISLAKIFPLARFYASDIFEDAIRVAKDNAVKNRVEERITFLLGDLLAPFKGLEGKLDAVVSNPPYIPGDKLDNLPDEVRLYEPKAAVDGGKGGTEIQKRIISEAWPYLREGGILALEVGDLQSKRVMSLMEGRYGRIEVFPDLNGIKRVVMGRKAQGEKA
jgi:release factor glutamine methyltransferase